MPVRYILLSVCLRLSQFSQSSVMQYFGLCVFSLPIYLLMIVKIFALHHIIIITLQWRHNGGDSVSNHQPHDCFLNPLFRHRSKKTSKLRDTGLCAGNSPEAGEFPAQMASYAENVSIYDVIMKWEIWIIGHCLGLGDEKMAGAVCCDVFLLIHAQTPMVV